MLAVFDFVELVEKLRPHILVGKLVVSLFGALLDFWLPVVVLSILWAHARFATRAVQTSPDGDAGLGYEAEWASMRYAPEIHGTYVEYLASREEHLGENHNNGYSSSAMGRFRSSWFGRLFRTRSETGGDFEDRLKAAENDSF